MTSKHTIILYVSKYAEDMRQRKRVKKRKAKRSDGVNQRKMRVGWKGKERQQRYKGRLNKKLKTQIIQGLNELCFTSC